MSDEDPFYEKLPFTISQDQATPEWVILGTGLQECLLAAHFSKMHLKQGLVIDTEKLYGSCLKTITFKELHELYLEKNKEKLYKFFQINSYHEKNLDFYNKLIETKTYRGYNLDIEPNFFFGNSTTCQMLKQTEMDKYMDFRLVYNMLHYDGKGLKSVPLSKGKIFQSKDLGLLEKKLLLNTFHSLIQIYNKYMQVEEDQNSTKQFDKDFGKVDEKLYSEFLSHLNSSFVPWIEKLTKKNRKIMDYLTFIICNYQYNYYENIPEHMIEEYTTKGLIQRFGKFIRSCGVYGELPYLYVDNGIGDIPQAYSRIASIFGSTYILHPKITIDQIRIQESEQRPIKIKTNLYPDKEIQTKQIFYGPTFYNQSDSSSENFIKQYILRVLLIAEKEGKEQQCPSIVYFLNAQGFPNPIYMFMFDSESHTCPRDFITYQFETVIPSDSLEYVQQQVHRIVSMMNNVRGENFSEGLKYCCPYVRYKYHEKQKKSENKFETFLKDHQGIDLDSHFLHFKKIVGELPHYFGKKKQENEEEENENNDYQTMGLIERLQKFDFEKKIPKEEQQINQEKLDENKEQQKENKKEQQKEEQQKEEQKEEQQKEEQKDQKSND